MKHLLPLLVLSLVAFPFSSRAAEAKKPEPQPLTKAEQSVYDSYLKIQTALAGDAFGQVKANATAMATAIRATAKDLPADIAKQADTLGQTKDIKAARAALKDLSTSMIKLLGDRKVAKGTYYEVFCPMVDASWLQVGKAIKNPYMGKSMLDCGVIKE